MDWQKTLPGLVIAAIVIYAISRLRSSGSPQVYNALIPTSTQAPDNRDAARTEAFSTLASVGLGQLKLDSENNQALQAIDLAKQRFSNTLDLARIQQQGLTDRLLAQLTDRNYDRELQQRALDQTFALAQTGQLGQQAGSLINSILGALRGNSASQAGRSGGASGGGSGLPSSPPLNPNARSPQRANWNVVANWLDRYRNQAINLPDYEIAGQVPYVDLSPWDWAFGYGEDGFDYWNRYYNNYDMLEPVGSVSTSYDLFDPRGWWYDWGFGSESEFWDNYEIDPYFYL